MAYKIRKYLVETGEQMVNIWDTVKRSWIFGYNNPKYKITKTNLDIENKEIYEITDEKGKDSYLLDILSNTIYDFGLSGINFKKTIFDSNEFSIYGKDNHQFVIFKNGHWFQLPDNEHKVFWAGETNDYVYVSYDTKKLQNNELGRIYEHTIMYFKIFDRNTGEELFKDKNIKNLLLDSSYKQVFAFSDESTTYFINGHNITVTFPEYVIDTVSHVLNNGKENECYFLTDAECRKAMDNSDYEHPNQHKIIVDKSGNIIHELDGQFVEDLHSDTISMYYSYMDKKTYKSKTNISKTYGDQFPYQWIRYRKDNKYVRIENYKGESLLKYDDITDIKIDINNDGAIFYSCIRGDLIYIYDEQWNLMSGKWVIYNKYYEKSGNLFYQPKEPSYCEIDRAIWFDAKNNVFRFCIAYVKKNDGSTNTGRDWEPKGYKRVWDDGEIIF